MKNKNTIYIILGVLVVVVAVLFLSNMSSSLIPNTDEAKNNRDEQALPPGKEMPKFILGSVSGTEGQNIFIMVGTEEKKIVTDSDTTIVKQIKEGDAYKNVPANFSEIKSQVQIVIYYSTGSGSEFKADKVQILNF